MVTGNTIGGTYESLGHTTTDYECANLVKSTMTSANAASWYIDGTYCYAQFDATGIDNDDSAYRACLFTGRQYNFKINYLCALNIYIDFSKLPFYNIVFQAVRIMRILSALILG